MSNNFSLCYNKFEKGIERQLNPPCSFPSVFLGGNDLIQSPRLFEHYKDGGSFLTIQK